MIMTAEITMYPFNEDFKPKIKAYIKKLASSENLKITTYPTCTVLVGDYDNIMDVVKDSIAWSHTELGKSVFITKFLPGYDAG
jgi:uncharacterized protein YqgV (UPF0045/DUF77 family)